MPGRARRSAARRREASAATAGRRWRAGRAWRRCRVRAGGTGGSARTGRYAGGRPRRRWWGRPWRSGTGAAGASRPGCPGLRGGCRREWGCRARRGAGRVLPGRWRGPAGRGRAWPVMVMPCSRATRARNRRGMPVWASSCRRFLPAVMYSRSKNSRVRMVRACWCRCHTGARRIGPTGGAGRGTWSSASRRWPLVVPSRAAASATGSPPVMTRWPTASRSMSSGSGPGRSRPAQQPGGGDQVQRLADAQVVQEHGGVAVQCVAQPGGEGAGEGVVVAVVAGAGEREGCRGSCRSAPVSSWNR